MMELQLKSPKLAGMKFSSGLFPGIPDFPVSLIYNRNTT